MRILIVEDDHLQAEAVMQDLEDLGHEVFLAADGMKAIGIIVQRKIKCVIADWEMPRMDGVTLCRAVRSLKQTGYIYFVMVTSKTSERDMNDAFDAGVDDFMAKPHNRTALKAKVRVAERIIDLERKLEDVAYIDSLTELGNRRGFSSAIKRMHNQAQRYGTGYGLIMIDVDYFKKFNDTYGHLSGDRALREVSKAIQKTIRSADEPYRYGGEEMAVLIPEQNEQGILRAAERVRAAVEALRIEHKNSPRGIVTVSCGVALYRNGIQSDQVVEEADMGLYAAKEAGRNAVQEGKLVSTCTDITGPQQRRDSQAIQPEDTDETAPKPTIPRTGWERKQPVR